MQTIDLSYVNIMTDQQTVFVTGGASGIGFAIVQAALAEGWRAIVADVQQTNLDRSRDALRQWNGKVRFARLNVADEEEVVQSIAQCEEEFGPLTGVVNAAGIATDTPALETSAELFRRILDVNLIGSFVVSREAAKNMQAHGAGSIVNITSVSGIVGNEGRVAYGASKGALITMTKVMAVELASSGIRVNAIAPGPIETSMAQQLHTPEVIAAWISSIPQRRYGSPSDIASATLFLLDGRKSGYVTGQTICVDGGFTSAGIMKSISKT
jgi:NAD(P)-dependent dehydrogenase (short-subunit alcohol dehydrogenase family)